MSTEAQTVVVIQDASRDVGLKAIEKALKKLSVKAGDQLIIIAILNWFSSPSMFSFFGRKSLGYMVSVDSSYFVSSNKKIIEENYSKRKNDYHMNRYINKLSDYCQMNEIEFQLEVRVGAASQVTSEAVKQFQPTTLILDRQIHRNMTKFMDRIPCGMYRITSDNSIEKLKDPKSLAAKLSERHENISYSEMIPGSEEDGFSFQMSKSSSSTDLFTSGVSSQCSTDAATSGVGSSQYVLQKCQVGEFLPEQEKQGRQSLFHISGSQETSQTEVNQKGIQIESEILQMEEDFTFPVCSVCNNKRLKIGSKRDFSYIELYTATQGFSAKNFLSEGGFGSVYKGQVSGMTIAVKQHKSASFQGEKEFRSEVNVLRKARHENVVMLLGSCSEGNNRLLVYEYVCNGSLDQHLSENCELLLPKANDSRLWSFKRFQVSVHDGPHIKVVYCRTSSRQRISETYFYIIDAEHSRSPLTWEDRIKVAIGAARGLLYLHKNNIIHRDVRPNNILVTHDLQPLIGDFGLARTHNKDLTHSTEVVGTWGYLAPEYAEYGKVSSRTDVYSFGVVLLQLITGMRTTDKRLGGRSLVGWARPLLRERNYPDLIDERIIDTHDYHQLFWMVRLAEKCLSRDPKKRLSMAAVVNALTDILEGNTCDIGTGDYSPARSDSSYSESEFDENDENEPFQHGELLSTISESTESNEYISQMRHMTVRQPPSPPIKSICSSGSNSFQFSDESSGDYEAHNESNREMPTYKMGLLNS